MMRIIRVWLGLIGLTVASLAIPQAQPGGNAYVPMQIVAGTNVTISPTSGVGKVTINATGGGGAGTVTSVTCGTGLTGGTFTTSGTCALATALPSGTTATTQTAGDTSTDVATDAFVSTIFAAPPSIGSTTPAAGAFTTLSASGAVSGTGFSAYLASPPAIGGTAAAAGTFTALTASGGLTLTNSANAYTQTSTGLSLTSGTTGFGRDITGTVNDSSAVDGIIDFANITCTTCTATSFLVDWQVGGTSQFKFDTSGNETIAGALLIGATFTAGATGQIKWNARGILTSPAAGQIQLGAPNAAGPVSQTVLTQGAIGGTNSNTAGGNLTIQSGLGTGNATGSTLVLQTPHATTSGTTQQTANTQISLGDNTVSMPNLASSSAATTGTVCWTTGGNLTVDTTLACLSSTARIKEHIEPLNAGLAAVMALNPVSYNLRPQYNPKGLGPMVGLVAEEVQKVDPRLVGLDANGEVEGVRYMQLTAVLVKAIQEQQQEIKALKRELHRRR